MNRSKLVLLAALALPLVLASCRGQISEKEPIHPNMNMDQQNRFEAQESNPFFEDNRSMRMPVEGTVARGNLRADKAYYQGINPDSSFVEEMPVELSRELLNRGQRQYNVYCSVCHGVTGAGNGIIMEGQYGFVPAPTFHMDRIRDLPDGHLYSVIANGIRTMPGYGHQVKVEDRWAIVAYLRALQRSQNVSEEEMQQYEVDLAALQQEYAARMQAEQEREAAASAGEEISAERGQQLFTQNGCQGCHSIDGSDGVGPTHQNLFGRTETMEDGSTVTVDSAYVHDSIVNPSEQIVEGYQPVMVPYDYLSEAEIASIIAYLRTLSDNQ
ncbi:MAG: c-type cytochrome [Balneolaceae bacterium]|nr:c-type cytochrome [Balneolaceae bacterium]